MLNVLRGIKSFYELVNLFCILDKALKETLDKILLSSYFDQTQTHQNGVCEEEEEEEEEEEQQQPQPPQPQQQQPAPVEPAECEEQPAEPGMNNPCVHMTIIMRLVLAVTALLVFLLQSCWSLKNSQSPLKWKQQRLVLVCCKLDFLFFSFIFFSGCLKFFLEILFFIIIFFLQFVNRKFIPEAAYNTSTEKEQGGDWAVSSEVRSGSVL